jgi:hypothetical protein
MLQSSEQGNTTQKDEPKKINIPGTKSRPRNAAKQRARKYRSER